MKDILIIAAGGAFGTVGRYGVSALAARWWGSNFPYGTLLVNVLGSLALGACMHAYMNEIAWARAWRMPVAIGVLGAFTTFSTFSYESFRLLHQGNAISALTNVFANLLLGLLAVWLGWTLGRHL